MYTILSSFIHKRGESSFLTDKSLEGMEEGLCAYRIRRVQNVEDSKWEACRVPNWHLFYKKAFVGFMSKEASRWEGERMHIFKYLSAPCVSPELMDWIRKDSRRVVDQAFDRLIRKTFVEFRNGTSSFVSI